VPQSISINLKNKATKLKTCTNLLFGGSNCVLAIFLIYSKKHGNQTLFFKVFEKLLNWSKFSQSAGHTASIVKLPAAN
jgi:hypothetical protein